METAIKPTELLFANATLWPLAGLYLAGILALAASSLGIVKKTPGLIRLFAVIALGLAGYLELQTPFGPEVGHSLLHDPFSRFFKLASLFGVLTLVTVTGSITRGAEHREPPPFFFGATMLSAAGLLFLSSAYDIFTLFIGVELSVFPLYLYLFHYARTAERGATRSEERRLTFLRSLLFGGFASLSLAFGLAILFAIGGATELIQMRINLSVIFLTFRKIGPALLIGMLFCAVGLGSRIGLTPVNVWYAELKSNRPPGALPLGLTAGALAGLIGIARLFNNGLIAFSDPVMAPLDWPPIMLTLMTVTLFFSSAVILKENRLDRIVFWLVVSQGAYALFGLSLFSSDGLSASFYHIFCVVVAGAVALSISDGLAGDSSGDSGDATLDSLAGFARRQPLAAGRCRHPRPTRHRATAARLGRMAAGAGCADRL